MILPLAHVGIFAGGFGLVVYLIIALIAAICDDGSRYLCPRCGASLRAYVKSCRFCRARFKVQPFTQTRPERTRIQNRSTKTQKFLDLPASTALRNSFCLPGRGHYELNATQQQKRKLELMGSSNYEMIDSLGREQAQYLIDFHESLQIAEEVDRRNYASALRAESLREHDKTVLVWVGVVAGIVVVIVGAIWWSNSATLDRQREHDEELVRRANAEAEERLHGAAVGSVTATTVTTAAQPKLVAHAISPPETGAAEPPKADKNETNADNIERSRLNQIQAESLLRDQVAASRGRALAKYPALGVAGSEINIRFVYRAKRMLSEKSARIQDPRWPEKLADECAADSQGNLVHR